MKFFVAGLDRRLIICLNPLLDLGLAIIQTTTKQGGRNMNVMQIVQETAALKGTFIEELFEAMQNGQLGSPDEPVADGERVVGEMNELEKALYSLVRKYGETERGIVNRFRGKGKSISSKEKPALEAQLESCRSRFQVASKLMWENIETRLAGQKTPLSTGWGVRLDGQIVLMFGDSGNDRNPLGDLLGLALMERMMRG